MSDLKKGSTPAEKGRTATVVLDFIKSRRARAVETAASLLLKSSFGAPAIPGCAEEDVEDFGGDFGFL